jgi:SOUL heme-binding protein
MISKWTWIAMGLGAVVLAAGVWSQMSSAEEPKFTVIEKNGIFELRDYPSIIVAEATMTGSREIAINQGFRVIADYIFGNNVSAKKVAMTAPVIQVPGEKIAMTAPVTQQGEGNAWTVRFVMPSEYTLDTLPKPNNSAVTLKSIEGQRLAVVRFSGVANDAILSAKTAELTALIAQRNLSPLSPPSFAFYDPPWKLGSLRRNEVMIAVGK